jgi:hypothetical protein
MKLSAMNACFRAGLSTCGGLDTFEDTRRYTFGVMNLTLDVDTGEDDALAIL